MQRTNDLSIVGAGIAGLSCAYWAAKSGLNVEIFEQEAQICMHSSGRNAAMFRQVEENLTITNWATQSRNFLNQLFNGQSWLKQSGSLFLYQDQQIGKRLKFNALHNNIPFEELSHAEALSKHAFLQLKADHRVLFFPKDGVLDIHAITQKLYKECLHLGVQFHFSSHISKLKTKAQKITCFTSTQNTTNKTAKQIREVSCNNLLLANGAWLKETLATQQMSYEIKALRRHLLLLNNHDPKFCDDRLHPYIWYLGKQQFYMREEADSWLCSPCDETELPACLPPIDPNLLYSAIGTIKNFAPSLSGNSLITQWACLRTFTKDRMPLCEQFPKLQNLYIHGALGGHGMSIAMATSYELISKLNI